MQPLAGHENFYKYDLNLGGKKAISNFKKAQGSLEGYTQRLHDIMLMFEKG